MSSVKKQNNRQVIKIFKLRSSLGLLKSLHVRSSSCSSDNFSATFNLPDFIHWNKKLYSIKKIKKSEISINMCQQILIFFLLTHIICQFRFTVLTAIILRVALVTCKPHLISSNIVVIEVDITSL